MIEWYDGKQVTKDVAGNYLAHKSPKPLASTIFLIKTDFPLTISEVPSSDPNSINLKVSEITPDYPVAIDHIVSTPVQK
jgi:hypothetical protein